MKKVIIAAISISALTLTTVGMAATSTSTVASSKKSGVYVSGNVGYGKINVIGAGVAKNTSVTWNAAAGYQFNQYVAVEGGYMHLPRLKVIGTTIKSSAFFGDVKVMYPVSKLDIFAKGGIARTNNTAAEVAASGGTISKKHVVVGLAAVGVDYNISKNLAVSVESLGTFKRSGMFPATYSGLAGLTYKF